ncbi:hypothetical protein A3759_08825 [Thalassolituus sp. HI0120]|nr:hypothetical protein A3759_08825 [Thalassolituus sp. HI0120]
MKTLKLMLLTVIAMAMVPMAMAQDLTAKQLEQWLVAMPVLTQWLSQHEEKLAADDVMKESASMDQVFAKGVEQLREKGLYKDFNKQVTDAGFQNVEQWAGLSRDITMAYMAIEMENEMVSASQMEAQLRQLQSAEGLSPSEKAMMEQMMKASLMMVQAANKVPAKNKAIVRPYVERIAQQFDEQRPDSHQH